MPKILLINGPNLNLLGVRDVSVYGPKTLKDIENETRKEAESLDLECDTFQSNSEGAIVDRIHQARGDADAILINAGAYTHTSAAIHDALAAADVPVIEIHMSNIYAREEFRHHSFLSSVTVGQITGFGANSYLLAVRAARMILHDQDS